MVTCLLCQPAENTGPAILDHIRLLHPDAWDDGFDRWPDGTMVIIDQALQPADFGGE